MVEFVRTGGVYPREANFSWVEASREEVKSSRKGRVNCGMGEIREEVASRGGEVALCMERFLLEVERDSRRGALRDERRFTGSCF